MLPRDRFIVFTFEPKDGDPRGQSLLAPAYNPWWLKSQNLPEYFRYLKQFATPMVVGKTPENAGDEPQRDANGVVETNDDGTPKMLSPQQALFNSLNAFLGAYIMVAPYGSEIDMVTSQGEGEAFRKAVDLFDRQIVLAIHGSTRLALEAEHGSKADSQTGQDVVGLRIATGKDRLGACLTRDLVRPLILMNYGADALELAPKVTLATVEQQDKAKMIAAYAQAMAAGLIHESQLQAIHADLGMPPADYAAMARDAEDKAMNARLAAGELGKLTHPADPAADPHATA